MNINFSQNKITHILAFLRNLQEINVTIGYFLIWDIHTHLEFH